LGGAAGPFFFAFFPLRCADEDAALQPRSCAMSVPADGVAYPLHVGASMTGSADASSFTLLRCARPCACSLARALARL